MGYIISEVNDGFKYKVFRGNTNEEIDFEQVQLRSHQDWIKDKWVAAPKVLFLSFSLSASCSCFLQEIFSISCAASCEDNIILL